MHIPFRTITLILLLLLLPVPAFAGPAEGRPVANGIIVEEGATYIKIAWPALKADLYCLYRNGKFLKELKVRSFIDIWKIKTATTYFYRLEAVHQGRVSAVHEFTATTKDPREEWKKKRTSKRRTMYAGKNTGKMC